MMFAVGDVVSIFAPTVGYDKYHLCIKIGEDGGAHQFLFMNSEERFDSEYSVNCRRVPCLPPSRTGKTVFSFTMVPKYNDKQLKIYRADKKGSIDSVLAADLLQHVEGVQTLTKSEKRTILVALRFVTENNAC